MTQAARFGGGLRHDVCLWREVADVRTRKLGPRLLGLTVARTDKAPLFLGASFGGIAEIAVAFEAMGKPVT